MVNMNYWVVVVDDDNICLNNVRALLGGEDVRISCLRCGRDLLRFLEKNEPDLILLDIIMPDMDGFETYDALRNFEKQTGRTPLPVIFLTGENDSDTEKKGLRIGASDFIHKPFNKDVLLRRIKNVIANSKMIDALTEEAATDKLTGFLNKASGSLRVKNACETAKGVLLILDLDNFKLVNDLFGHETGDRVLQVFSYVLRSRIDEKDMIVRIGGDEFLVFMNGDFDERTLNSFAIGLNTEFCDKTDRLIGKDNGIPLGISVGAVMVPEHGRDFESLFSYADSAMYSAKRNGKHGYYLYNPHEVKMDSGEIDLEREMDRITMIVEERNDNDNALVLETEEFSLVYRFIMRHFKIYGGNAVKLLFSAVVKDQEADIEEVLMVFEELLLKQLHRSDLIMRCGSNRFFVILMKRNEQEALKTVNTVIDKWKDTRHYRSAGWNYVIRTID